MDHAVLYSGGLDSFLVHHWLNHENIEHELLYFALGAKYMNEELRLFNKEEFKKIIKIPVNVSSCLQMGTLEHDDAFIPNRNILAAIMAHSVTNYSNFWIGGTLSDRVNDNNKVVFEKLSELLTDMYGRRITFDSPFWDQHKPDLIKSFVTDDGWGQYKGTLEAQQALVKGTFSCYSPLDCRDGRWIKVFYDPMHEKRVCTTTMVLGNHVTTECLKCPACFRKCMSLYAGGIFIPMEFGPEAISVTEKYYCEAKKYLNAIDDEIPFNDEIMKPRMQATVEYVDKLRRYWRSTDGN